MRGIAMLETVIVLPLLILMILGTAEFAHAFWEYNALTKALRDGGRFASNQGLLGSTGVVVLTDDLREEVRNVVVYGNTRGTGAPVISTLPTGTVTLEAPGDGDIIVRASCEYDALFGLIPTFYGAVYSAPFTLNAALRMRAL
jgi:Flp pilus assembly protein TadG